MLKASPRLSSLMKYGLLANDISFEGELTYHDHISNAFYIQFYSSDATENQTR